MIKNILFYVKLATSFIPYLFRLINLFGFKEVVKLIPLIPPFYNILLFIAVLFSSINIYLYIF